MRLRMIAALALAAALWLPSMLAAPAHAARAVHRQEPASPEPKKSNSRTEGQDRGAEPWDHAPVEKMAQQCVTLDTEAGAIVIEMLAETAPETVRNFLNLAATGALNGTTFSRVVKDFVIQGGNLWTRPQPLTRELAERATRRIPDEPNAMKHVRGIVSMARSDKPNSATTNFFILVGEAPHLDGKFAAFGRVTSGMEIVDKINSAPVEGDKPVKPVRISRALVATCAAASAR